MYSDYFQFYPYCASPMGGVVFQSSMVQGWADDTNISGQCLPEIYKVSRQKFFVEEKLWGTLLKAWELFYINKKLNNELLPLFRSLETSYQALYSPSDQFTSIYDIGNKIALWISALEIITHPGVQQITKEKVAENFLLFDFNDKKYFKWKRYTRKTKKGTRYISLIEKPCYELYSARNNFLHGEPVSIGDLHIFKDKKRGRLDIVGIFLFRIALLIFLKKLFPDTNSDIPLDQKSYSKWLNSEEGKGVIAELISRHIEDRKYENALKKL